MMSDTVGDAGNTNAEALCAFDQKLRQVEAERDRLSRRVEELEQGMAAEARIVEAQALDVKALGKGRKKILTAQVKRMRDCALGGPARPYVQYHARDWKERLRRDIEAASLEANPS